MPERIRFRHFLEFLRRFPKEGSAGAGQDQAADLTPVSAAHQALENRGVFRVHRDNLCAVFPGSLHDQRAGADQRLLVGKGDALFSADRGQRRAKAQHADHRRYDGVRLFVLRSLQKSLHPGENAELLSVQSVLQLGGRLRRRHNGKLRLEFAALLCHEPHIAARRQRGNSDRKLFQHLKRLPSDGACAAENRYTLCHITLPQTG